MAWNPFRRRSTPLVAEAAAAPAAAPARAGFEFGIGRQGLTEYNQGTHGGGDTSDRAGLLEELYETYLSCSWAGACVDAIARTMTAGGVQINWAGDDHEGDQVIPAKPAQVLKLQALLDYVNPRETIRQVIRGIAADLLVFGDAFIEVVWALGEPAALYSLDAPSMRILADDHGQVTGYAQITEQGQKAAFEPHEVIHFSLDAPRGGLQGVSPTQKAMLPITVWLFTKALQKEVMRKGAPPNLHVDQPAAMATAEIRRWDDQYRQRNLGPKNVGAPILTKGGAQINELQTAKLPDLAAALNQCRDEIISAYGVPPAQVGIIESGNLGGGTGESQHKTFLVNTVGPLAEEILEELNFALCTAFGISGWRIELGDVDWRDSQAIEAIRDMRLRNGSWTLNRYRDDVNEPPVDGGDEAVLIDRQNLVLWSDMVQMSKAMVAGRAGPGVAAGLDVPGMEMQEPPEPAAAPPPPAAGVPDGPPPDDTEPDDGTAAEAWRDELRAMLAEVVRG